MVKPHASAAVRHITQEMRQKGGGGAHPDRLGKHPSHSLEHCVEFSKGAVKKVVHREVRVGLWFAEATGVWTAL